MNVVIIDDEKPARDSLETILKTNYPEVVILAQADSLKTGIEVLNQHKPDVLFLDVNLFDGSGFNLLEHFEQLPFHVIFVTAFNKFAVKAFRYNALDYILKPISTTELSEAIRRVKSYKDVFSTKSLKSITQNWNVKKTYDQKIAIRENDGIRYINISMIRRCQSDSNYTKIHLVDGEKIMTSRTLKSYTEILEEFGFYRIHQSHLVNLEQIKKIISRDGHYVELSNGEIIELSRSRKEQLYVEMESRQFNK